MNNVNDINESMTTFECVVVQCFAYILIYWGISSVFSTFLGLFNDSLQIEFSFMGIFIGKGLLEYKRRWYGWGQLCIWCGIVLPVIFLIIAISGGFSSTSYQMYGIYVDYVAPTVISIVFSIFIFAMSVLLWLVYSKELVKRTFDVKGVDVGVKFYTVFVLSIFLNIANSIEYYSMNQFLRSIDSYQTTVVLLDSETNEVIKPVAHFNGRAHNTVLPKVSTTFPFNKVARFETEISWVASTPISLGFSSNGYRQKIVRLGPKDDNKTVKVKLEKITTNTRED